MKTSVIRILIILSFFLYNGCSSLITITGFYEPINKSLSSGNFDVAFNEFTLAKQNEKYDEKDALLKHFDEGILYHYLRNYDSSNIALQKADLLAEDLFTKSISRAVSSFLLNDNALVYSGEVHENIYVNVFKALNYAHLKKYDEVYVEVKRVTDKLKFLETKYSEIASEFNKADENKISFDHEPLNYYSNVLANYISHIVFRAEGEEDNSRISLQNLNEAWDNYPNVYNFPKPKAITETSNKRGTFLNIFAFSGKPPLKKAVGARITTLKDYLVISNPDNYQVQPIYFPGIPPGWNFKFSFPVIEYSESLASKITLSVNGNIVQELELLEDFGLVAEKTFESQKSLTYLKTIVRAVTKGISSKKISEAAERENSTLGGITSILTNVLSDISENPDLRCWRTLPGLCFTGEIEIPEGKYDLEVKYLDKSGNLLSSQLYSGFQIETGLNIIESYYLN